jgi:hypothetical protein
MRWVTFYEPLPNSNKSYDYQLMPVGELGHTRDMLCKCKPQIRWENKVPIISHNSFKEEQKQTEN